MLIGVKYDNTEAHAHTQTESREK